MAFGGSASLVCIQCGAFLFEMKCKLRCPRCGYFEDCSDGGTNIVQQVQESDFEPPRIQAEPAPFVKSSRFPYPT